MRQTRRQEIVERLKVEETGFGELREEMGLTVAVLRTDLEHIARSLGQRLRIRPPRCLDCGFVARPRLTPPGRCPSCRGHRFGGPWLRVADGGV